VPKPASSGFLVNPTSPFADSDIADVQRAADKFGQKLSAGKAATENDIGLAFTTLKRFPPDLNRRDSQRVKDERFFVH
jgi:hypothetical protein